MKKILTILMSLLTISAFAATEQAWYNDVTSIANNGQYYIYSVNGKGFMQAGQNSIKTVNQNNYSSNSDLLFTITKADAGKTYSGSSYVSSYQYGTCGPVGEASTDGSDVVWTAMSNNTYWNIHGKYSFLGTKYAALYYNNGYAATANVLGNKETQTGTQYQWWLITSGQYDRHWAIYLYDRYKESIADYTKWENLVPAAYYTALADAYAVTYNVKNTEHSKDVVNAHRADLKTLYDNAAAVAEAYANANTVINALEAVEDKGEDFAEVTAGITTARTAIEEAMSVEALNAAVSAPSLKAIDPITFNVTVFTAGQTLGTPASTAAGRTIIYEAADKNIINAAGLPIYKGTTTLTATAAATNEYYKFVRSAQVTVNAENTDAQESMTITYGENKSWHGTNLSTYTVGSHELTFDTLNVYGGNHTITLNLTVNKIATLNVPVELAFCAGGSESYRGVEYTEAGTFPVSATGATRDTVYNVTVTVLQPTFGTDSKTIAYGAEVEWNGIDLSEYTVGNHQVPFVTTNAAGCDSTVTLNLVVTKTDVVEVPVELTFCPGSSEIYRGVEYTEAGLYPVYAEGEIADTVYNVNVTVLQPTFGTDTKTIIYGAEEFWNGIALADSTVGVHTVTYVTTNAAGCDSTVTLNLTVNKIETLNVPVELTMCEGGVAHFRDNDYVSAGTDLPYLVSDPVRDTLFLVTVTVLQPTFGSDDKTIVYGAEVEWNGIDLSEYTVGSHEVPFVTTNAAGCDSTVTLNLIVTKTDAVEIPVALMFCEGDSVEYRGTTYKAEGLYPVYAEGEIADTVYNVTVTVNQPYFGEDELTMQYGDAEEWNGIDLSEMMVGTHVLVDSLQTVMGCDSIIQLSLTVEKMDIFEAEQELEFCEGDSVEFRGVWYSTAGEYPVLVEGEVRDTLINVIVTVHEKAYAEIERTVLAGDVIALPEGEWHYGDEIVSGEYATLRSDTLGFEFIQYDLTDEGCESIKVLYVTVEPNHEAIDNVFVDEKAQKFFRDGVLYIRRGEKIYTAEGREIK